MKSKHIDDEDESFKKPTDEEIQETTETTRAAIEKITTAKVLFSLMNLNFLFSLGRSSITRSTCKKDSASTIYSLYS